MPSDLTYRPIDFAVRRDRNAFIDVPYRLYPKDSNWVPHLRFALGRILNPKKNPFYHHAQMTGWIAVRDGKAVGRIAAIVNGMHNTFHEEKTGFFGFFECIDDAEVAHGLFDLAKAWLVERGMDRMRGPANPSTNEECGLLIDAFDKRPLLMMPYNPPYYRDLIESYGFAKAKDLLAFWKDTESGMSERVTRIANAIRRRTKVTLRPIDLKNLKEEIVILRNIYERAWEKNWGFVPLTEAEFDYAVDDLKEAVDPGGAYFAEIDGEAVGFCAALLDLNQIFAKIPDGRLFPTGLFTLLREKKRINAVRVALLGVLPEYRKRGIDALFYMRLYERSVEANYLGGELSWILEDNTKMVEGAKAMGAEIDKTYRIFDYEFE